MEKSIPCVAHSSYTARKYVRSSNTFERMVSKEKAEKRKKRL